MKIENKSIKQLRSDLDKYFSLYIRHKYADSGDRGYVSCYTCGKKDKIENMQCGHFISRAHSLTRWDKENARVQCLTKESSVTIKNGELYEKKTLNKVKVGDDILGFDENTFEKKIAKVLDVKTFLSEVYEVEMENGKKFYATGDHKIVVDGEWKRIDEILQDYNGRCIMDM